MSNHENHSKWNDFLEIGDTIHKMKGRLRILEATRGLILAEELLEARFITRLPLKDLQLYKTLLPKIACYLDGNAEVIQNAVEKYFLVRHCKAGLDENQFQVSFSPKKSGIQTGFVCNVSDGTQTTTYFVKTHQYGPTESRPRSAKPPDTKELFIYQFLNRIGIGPDVHFILPSHGTKRTIYIATKDCHLTHMSALTTETANMKSLVQLDLISRILCLRDCATNPSNCGQVNGKPMIVDFRIETESIGYAKSDILIMFFRGNGEFNYMGLMEVAVKISEEEKICILRESLQTWNLVENIDSTLLELRPLIQKIAPNNPDDDLQRYVQDVKENIKILSQF